MSTDDPRPLAVVLDSKMLDAFQAKIDELHSVIDRSTEALDQVGIRSLVDLELFLHRQEHFGLSHAVKVARESVQIARFVLAEADPADPESHSGKGSPNA